MARLSDIIEIFIKEMLEENRENEVEIQRNELANYFSCAPSQINYVLTTRFTTDKGYYIESRRGGGGCIKITRIELEKHESLSESINKKIDNSITYDCACKIINGLEEAKIITKRESDIVKVSINDRTLMTSNENKNKLRADILKTIVMYVLR